MTTDQIGRLHFYRKRGEAIYVFPKTGFEQLPAQALFRSPLRLVVADLSVNKVRLTITADTRLSVVRERILNRSSLPSPRPEFPAEAALQQRFYQLAQQELDPVVFASLNTRANARLIRERVASTLAESVEWLP